MIYKSAKQKNAANIGSVRLKEYFFSIINMFADNSAQSLYLIDA